MRQYFNNSLIRDSLWVLGATSILLILFLSVSFYCARHMQYKEYLSSLQYKKEFLEEKFSKESTVLMLIRARIQALNPQSYEKEIPVFLKENYQSLQRVDEGISAKYYLSIKKDLILLSALGRVDIHGGSLEAIIPWIKDQRRPEALYVKGEALYHVLNVSDQSYVILKRPIETIFNGESFQDSEIVHSRDLSHLPLKSLKNYECLEIPIAYNGKSFDSYIFLKNFEMVVLFPVKEPYSITAHLVSQREIILLIIATCFLFLIYMALVYRRIKSRIEQQYVNTLEFYKDTIEKNREIYHTQLQENTSLLNLQKCSDLSFKRLLSFNVRFHQLSAEIGEISKILIQNLTAPEKSIISLSEQLRLLVGIHQNADYLTQGTIKASNYKMHHIETLARQALELCQGAIQKNNINLMIEINDDVGESYLDDQFFIQFLGSTLQKSLERVPKGGFIKLVITRDSTQNKEALKIVIQDNGFVLEGKNLKRFQHQNDKNIQHFNPLNLPWVSLEAMAHQLNGTILKSQLKAGVNNTEVILGLDIVDENEGNNVVKLFGPAHAQ